MLNNNEILITRINELCKEMNVSINKMLIDSGAGARTIANLKRGSSASYETISKIADYFTTSTDYLLGKSDIKKPLVNDDEELTEYLEELKNRSEMRMLFKLAKGATKADVEKAVKIIEALQDDER